MYEFKVSVIIPTFNSSNTIQRLIHSLLNQDFKDFEIVFIDDASSDNTIDTIKKTLENTDLKYQILKNKINKGPGYSRNKGIEASKGRYIIFIDSDDVIHANHLRSLYDNAIINDIDSVFIKGIKLNKSNTFYNLKHDKFYPIMNLARKTNGIIKAYQLIELELEMKIPFYFVFLIYDKEIIQKNHLKFDERFNYGEDTTFALKYLSNSNNVKVLDECTYFYFQENNSITSTSTLNRFDSILLFEYLGLYLKELSKKTPDLNDSCEKLIHSRIPKFIFGNMNYFFYHDFNKDEIFKKMEELDLFNKLKKFRIYDKNDYKFYLKLKLFLLNPHLYYIFWKKFKNNI